MATQAQTHKVTAVLSLHRKGMWSDNTVRCQGCFRRVENDIMERRIPDDSQIYRNASKPDWTEEEYEQHLAEKLIEAGVIK